VTISITVESVMSISTVSPAFRSSRLVTFLLTLIVFFLPSASSRVTRWFGASTATICALTPERFRNHVCLVRVVFRKLLQRAIKLVGRSQVSGDHCCVTRLGMRPGQSPATQTGVRNHGRRAEGLDLCADLHIAELTQVVIVLFDAAQPGKISLAPCIRRWPSTTRTP